jgi:hypothetical protein
MVYKIVNQKHLLLKHEVSLELDPTMNLHQIFHQVQPMNLFLQNIIIYVMDLQNLLHLKK